MRSLVLILTLAACAVMAAINAHAQTNAGAPLQGQTGMGITPNRVAGEVTAIDATAHVLTIKADGSSTPVKIVLDDKTAFMRAKPNATSRADMTKISVSDIRVGDRVVALGKVSEDQKSVPARAVIMMSKEDHTAKQEHDREEWQRRGIVGNVVALNPAAREIDISVRSREGLKPVAIAAGGEKVIFRRYAPDSVKFSDAKPSSFAELKVGDQLRALGERSADSASFMPEEIVSGSFRQLLGTVTAVDPATNEVKIAAAQDKQLTSIVVNSDSTLRRLPPFVAQMWAQRAAGGGPGEPGEGAPAGASPRREGREGREGGRPPADAGGEQVAGGRRRAGGGFDAQAMLERMPPLTLTELKPGDMILVSSTTGADPSRVTAIALIAGVDALVNALPAGARRANVGGGASANPDLPRGIEFGIGLP